MPRDSTTPEVPGPTMPHSVGRYKLGSEIGWGNMAVVYRAFDPRLQREVAIKLLNPEYGREDGYRHDFLTEAHAAGALSHPGIVTIHDVGESRETPFIAMELLEGTTLRAKLDSSGALSAVEVIKIGIQLARALDYAHRHGVVHRDVKADNVMFTGQGSSVKLTDFGIARVLQSRSHTDSAEEPIVGTPEYMAPEQVIGGEVDGRTDLYALGVLMYYLLNGELPFDQENVATTFNAICHQPVPRVQPRDPRTPSALIDLVETLMAKSPEDRYQTGRELSDELVALLREMESGSERGWRLSLGVRWPVAMGLVVAATLIVGSVLVYERQRATMTDLVFDYGDNMAQFIAHETAEDLLIGDQVAVQAMVTDLQRNRQMEYLRIADRDGQIVASTEEMEVGSDRNKLPVGELIEERDGKGRVFRYRDGDTQRFLFEAPVVYRDQRIGELAVGVSTRPLSGALRVSLFAMGSLMIATMLTVLLGTWVLSWRLRTSLRVLSRGLDKVAEGDLDHRIRILRRDEIGDLFKGYNRMAEALIGSRADQPEADARRSRRTVPGAPTRRMDAQDNPSHKVSGEQ